MATQLSALDRFWSNVDTSGACWIWQAAKDWDGYGVFYDGERPRRTHRYAYELLVGPVPEGHELDHVKDRGCTSTLCVKAIADEHGPAHLEPVTHRVNVLRGESPSAMNARKTHCLRGHPFTADNTYVTAKGGRECRTCLQAKHVAYRMTVNRRAGMSALKQSGECTYCGHLYVLRKDGAVRGHSTPRPHVEPCPGSFQPPRSVRS